MNTKLLLVFVLGLSIMTLAACAEHICAQQEGTQYCYVYNPQPGCLCTAPGQCKNTEFDTCSICNNKTVYSYYAGESCPVQNSQNYWVPNRCPQNLNTYRCTKQMKYSCACYTDGTCKRIYSNLCNACGKKNIVSFNYGEKCPIVNNKINVCPIKKGENKFCTLYAAQGCKCYTNGKCETGYVNKCSDCRKDGVTLVVENGRCPVKSK